MTITVGDVATHNEQEVVTRYPVDEGLTAGTEKQTGRLLNLIAQEGSVVTRRESCGLNGR